MAYAPAAPAQPVLTLADGRDGRIDFESITPSNFGTLIRRGNAPKVVVAGVLSLPKGTGRVPAMVVAHGSGGLSDAREGRWADRLNEIGIMGFSRGGQVSFQTALEPVRRGIIDGDLRFAVHVPFYPPCNTIYVAGRVTGAPIRCMLAGSDDYTPPSYCARYVEWFRAKGVAEDSISYEGAYYRSCIGHGATVGGNHEATQKAAADLAVSLKQVFKL
jgi:dienelactone hydrolase